MGGERVGYPRLGGQARRPGCDQEMGLSDQTGGRPARSLLVLGWGSGNGWIFLAILLLGALRDRQCVSFTLHACLSAGWVRYPGLRLVF